MGKVHHLPSRWTCKVFSLGTTPLDSSRWSTEGALIWTMANCRMAQSGWSMTGCKQLISRFLFSRISRWEGQWAARLWTANSSCNTSSASLHPQAHLIHLLSPGSIRIYLRLPNSSHSRHKMWWKNFGSRQGKQIKISAASAMSMLKSRAFSQRARTKTSSIITKRSKQLK